MKTSILITIILIQLNALSYSQDTSGIIIPGATYTNQSQEPVYFLSSAKINLLLNIQDSARILSKTHTIYAELLDNTEARLRLSEQLTEEKQREIVFWKEELGRAEEELRRVRRRRRVGRWGWFIGGVLVGVVVW